MLRTLLVLFVLGLCGFYIYQKQQVEVPVPPAAARTVDESALQKLKDSLPAVIFEKDIQPTIERNRHGGLTQEQIGDLLDRLDTIGRALGGSVTQAVNQAAEAIAPDQFPRKTLADHAVYIADSLAKNAASGAKACLPVIEELAVDLLHALAGAVSFLLDKAADLIKGA